MCDRHRARSYHSKQVLCMSHLWLTTVLIFLLLSMALAGFAAPGAARYTYDVSPEGMVHVTIAPGTATSLLLPVTAENVKATDLKYDLKKDWKNFRAETEITPTGESPTISYDWPDGALPWPQKISDWLQQSEIKWCTDNFYTVGPAEVTIILPPGAEVLEYRELNCPKNTTTGSDGRVHVTFDVPDAKKVSWLGVVYKYLWAEKYSIYGKSPLPLYYPTVLGRYPEYMAKVKELYAACQEFYSTYQTELKYTPPADVKICLVSWIQGYGGAYTAGSGIHFNYRGTAGFEWPPVTDGGRLMGAYHEMGHAFQPDGYPEYIGGHTWTAYLTMDYDWNSFPTVKAVADRKLAGGSADAEFAKAYPIFVELNNRGILPGLWYKWADENPQALAYLKEKGCSYGVSALHEKSEAYAMLKMERDFGKAFWGRYGNVFLSSGLSYSLDEPVQQKLVAAQMSIAQGKDLTQYFSDLTKCDLSVKLSGEGSNILSTKQSAWKLESWKPGSRMIWDEKITHSGKASIRLESTSDNDLKVLQVVKVEPKTYYLLTAWVKTKDVPVSPIGATICTLPDDSGTRQVRGTTEWRQLSLPVYSGDKTEITVCMRIGWSGQPTSGVAWFDDIKLMPLFSKNGWKEFQTLGVVNPGSK